MAGKQSGVVKSLYYITHINNLSSILEKGILSHASIEAQKLLSQSIYDKTIVKSRRKRRTPDNKSLWEFANLYFQPRNPMLYRVVNEQPKRPIAIVSIKKAILETPNAFISIGNAASELSNIVLVEEGVDIIAGMWDVISSDWWKEEDGSKRKIMAELLVPSVVDPKFIDSIYVADSETADRVRAFLQISNMKSKVIPEPHMFFQPDQTYPITDTLFLVGGDMFFSRVQTLTISVNTVGVMGKGLASRTKYQFPDVYVFYEDLCKTKKLQIGKPYVYKRESSFDEMLSDNPITLPELNSNKWFLLFPTKKHWRNKSNLSEIEEGLVWLRDNFSKEGITSLALPALGCGLGGLDWAEVGPLMCRYLSDIGIQVRIYLPREQKISANARTRAFLLS